MITSIRLVNFKNFADETLRVGPFTVIVGANASGKSNIRDAFRFLCGIGRGYTSGGDHRREIRLLAVNANGNRSAVQLMKSSALDKRGFRLRLRYYGAIEVHDSEKSALYN